MPPPSRALRARPVQLWFCGIFGRGAGRPRLQSRAPPRLPNRGDKCAAPRGGQRRTVGGRAAPPTAGRTTFSLVVALPTASCSWGVREAERLAVVHPVQRRDERGGGGRARERVQQRGRLGGHAAAREGRHVRLRARVCGRERLRRGRARRPLLAATLAPPAATARSRSLLPFTQNQKSARLQPTYDGRSTLRPPPAPLGPAPHAGAPRRKRHSAPVSLCSATTTRVAPPPAPARALTRVRSGSTRP